jgi:squalene monooxygenase
MAGRSRARCVLGHVQDSRKTLVLEKCLEQPDRIVGELLQPGGYLHLKRMGLAECTQGIDAQEVYGYALFKDNKRMCVKYPRDGLEEDVAGRSFHHGRCDIQMQLFTAFSHQHVNIISCICGRPYIETIQDYQCYQALTRRFVQKLRHRAASNPTVCMRQGVALKLIDPDGQEWREETKRPVAGVSYKCADGTIRTAFAHLTVACDGMYSMLRKRLHESADAVR